MNELASRGGCDFEALDYTFDSCMSTLDGILVGKGSTKYGEDRGPNGF